MTFTLYENVDTSGALELELDCTSSPLPPPTLATLPLLALKPKGLQRSVYVLITVNKIDQNIVVIANANICIQLSPIVSP